jgi:hypothetical protein
MSKKYYPKPLIAFKISRVATKKISKAKIKILLLAQKHMLIKSLQTYWLYKNVWLKNYIRKKVMETDPPKAMPPLSLLRIV